ncbi:MrcB family domain-containing protein [Brevibacillus laterosporus]|uniref:MrcB family domain-containing protein n=1 Tax=Brevibacillus laterosporus TaxID=1465 RepID=UPI002E2059D6|nr:DUF3578 domain-containing protein [Brevibacillus laterosporus]MED1670308.1 DUF3578 domain-containing protein [Brevibacillus laterosporus]MED1717897.1 DUF3578 domain-containing protein [Brevibacillus laterosporus]
MRQLFIDILNTYNSLRNTPYQPTARDEAKLVVNTAPLKIRSDLNLNDEKYKVKGSVGAGRWTETPWISVFDKEITETAQKGFYIVYLFKKDMSGVYLSLNQGTTYIDRKYSGQQPREKMQLIAENIRLSLDYDQIEFPTESIDLIANTPNSKNYMAAHICGKYYDASSMPDNEQLILDLKNLLEVYNKLKQQMLGKSIEEILDYFLQKDAIEDTQFQSDVLVAQPTNTPELPQPVPPQVTESGRQQWKRNSSIAKEALEKQNYLCEADPEHLTFISEVTNQNFVEAHHLIPMKLQRLFLYSLDVPGNITSLCPNCHRKIHHANKETRKKIIELLYHKKKEKLSNFKIDIELNKLYKAYGC